MIEEYVISLERATHRGRDVICVRFPYKLAVISALRSLGTYQWSAGMRSWYISSEDFNMDLLRNAIGKYGRIDVRGLYSEEETAAASGLFQNRFRIASNRSAKHHYTGPGYYYLTLCTKNRTNWFGYYSTGGDFLIWEIGKIVIRHWQITSEIREDMNITMGDLGIAPDHIHGIIYIGRNEYNIGLPSFYYDTLRDARHGVSTISKCSVDGGRVTKNINAAGPQIKNLSSVVRGIKSAITVEARRTEAGFMWQSGFYDRIIRSPKELVNVQNYIRRHHEKQIP